MPSNFAEAVNFATGFLKNGVYSNGSKDRRAEPTEFLLMFGLQIKQYSDDHEVCSTLYKFPENAFKFLLLRADTDKGAFDLARRVVTTRVWRDEQMSPEERMFCGMVLSEKKRCPPSEGKRIAEQFSVNLHLVFLTRLLVKKFGLFATRNNESSASVSACDAVSNALENIGIHRTAHAIKNLLVHKTSQRVRDVVDETIAFIEQAQILPNEAPLLSSWVGDS